MNSSNFLEIPDGAIVLLGKTGVTNELIDEVVNSLLSDFTYKFHKNLVSRQILSETIEYPQWMDMGFPAHIIEPGSDWRKGRLRLRVVPEFILDEETENESIKPIEPSLDTFR
jgi:hypothetical protein